MMEPGWELKDKHIFILSDSGKPIFSYHGDEQEMVTSFGLLQAVVSIASDAGDRIKFIRAGNRKIVYCIRKSLYFICISSTGEPEVILLKQLQFLYQQILLVLTSKIHQRLHNNPSTDLRQLLGADTTQWMKTTMCHMTDDIESNLAPLYVAFESVEPFPLHPKVREEVHHKLLFCTEEAGAALGLLLYKGMLISIAPNASMDFNLDDADIALLIQYVSKSKTLQSDNQQHWIPVCLPNFNENAFLQAYVNSMKLVSGTDQTQGTVDMNGFSLVMIAVSADPEVFRLLHKYSEYFEGVLKGEDLLESLKLAVEFRKETINNYLKLSNSFHFLYKLNRYRNNREDNKLLPSQYICSSLEMLPIDGILPEKKILVQYQKLSLCLRRGTRARVDV